MANMSMSPQRAQALRAVRWFLWREALLSWGIPTVLTILLLGVVGLTQFAVVSPTTGAVGVGWLVLLLIAFFTFWIVFAEEVPSRLKGLGLGLGLIWVAVTGSQLTWAAWLGPQLLTETLSPGQSLKLELGKTGTAYALVLRGSFEPEEKPLNHEAEYRLGLEKDGHEVRPFAGQFSEHWLRRRLGRRGSVPSLQTHNQRLHRLASPGEGTYTLRLHRLDPPLTQAVQVRLLRQTYPEKTFWLLDVLLLMGVYGAERGFGEQEAGFVLPTGLGLAFVLVLGSSGAPPHSFQELLGAGMVAALVGPLSGWLFRLIATPLARLVSRALPLKAH